MADFPSEAAANNSSQSSDVSSQSTNNSTQTGSSGDTQTGSSETPASNDGSSGDSDGSSRDWKYTSPQEYFLDYDVFLSNAESIEPIHLAFEPYKHGLPKIQETRLLLENTRGLFHLHDREEGEDAKAYDLFDNLWNHTTQQYQDTLDFAREVFEDDPGAIQTLKLEGRRSRTKAGAIDERLSFYNNLLANPEYVEAMGEFGYTAESLNKELEALHAAIEANKEYERETGESQTVTIERDMALENLHKVMRRFYKVAEKALRNHPQWREKLGIVEK